MDFLTCEPPLNIAQKQNYLDEADIFYQNPSVWLKEKYKNEETALPTHLVMFNVLYPEILVFLIENQFVECEKVFHSHVTEGRQGSHVIVMCSKQWIQRKEMMKRSHRY